MLFHLSSYVAGYTLSAFSTYWRTEQTSPKSALISRGGQALNIVIYFYVPILPQ